MSALFFAFLTDKAGRLLNVVDPPPLALTAMGTSCICPGGRLSLCQRTVGEDGDILFGAADAAAFSIWMVHGATPSTEVTVPMPLVRPSRKSNLEP